MARTEWNRTPTDLPLQVNPVFAWPPRPGAVLQWYWGAWFPISVNLCIVALSFAAVAVAAPSLDQAAEPGLWIAMILLRNFVIIAVLAQGLHVLFHGQALQGGAHKYDPRPFPRQGRMFSFGDQYRDNAFWTLASGVPIWTAWETVIWWAMANGYAPLWSWDDGAIWFVAAFFLIPIWESFYFYWIHRLLHTNLLYRFHALQHRNTATPQHRNTATPQHRCWSMVGAVDAPP